MTAALAMVGAVWVAALAVLIGPRLVRPTPWHAIAEWPLDSEHDFGQGIDMGAFHSERAAELHANDWCPTGMVWRIVHEEDMPAAERISSPGEGAAR